MIASPIPGRIDSALILHQGKSAPLAGLDGYLRIRWAALGLYAVGCWFAALSLGFDSYGLPLSACLLLLAFTQLAAQARRSFLQKHAETSLLSLLIIDILGFTYLLGWTGGAHNPFATLYLLHVVIACIMLRAAMAAGMLVLSVGGYAYLLVLGRPLPVAEPPAYHYLGMVFAMALAGTGIAFFILRLNHALAAREKALEDARQTADRTRRLASVSTLAAGVAHALATPIGTMALIAEDIEARLASASGDAESIEDMRQLRHEIDRCRELLHKLGPHGIRDASEEWREASLGEIVDRALGQLEERQDRSINVYVIDRESTLHVPVESLVQALVILVTNALQASVAGGQVSLHVHRTSERIEWRIVDAGEGMSNEVLEKAGEPFFSTRKDGQHLGLGLFLVRSLAELLQGTLHFDSSVGKGTSACLAFPAHGVRAADKDLTRASA